MTEIFIDNKYVDTYKDLDISLNYAIADITVPDKRNTSFSKTIKLPGTKTNNILFSHIFDLTKVIRNSNSNINFAPEFNPNLKANCKIFEDNILQFNGVVQLLQINRNGEQYEYEVVVFGALKNIFLSVEGKNLEHLNMSEYDHIYQWGYMKNTWATNIVKNGVDYVNFDGSGNPKGEGYLYPTIDYGYTQSQTQLRADKMFPSIYVREYMSKIFAMAGFTWTSTFLDSIFFKRLIIPFNKADAILTDGEKLNRSFLARRSRTCTSYAEAYPNSLNYPNENFIFIFDDDTTTGAFDTTNQYNKGTGDVLIPATTNPYATSVYKRTSDYYGLSWQNSPGFVTIKKRGTYDFATDMNFLVNFYQGFGGPPTVEYSRVIISIIKLSGPNSTVIASTGTIDRSAMQTGFVGTLKASNIFMEIGEAVYVNVFYKVAASSTTLYTGAFTEFVFGVNSTFYCTPVSLPILLGDQFYLNSAIPKGVAIKDFFNSIIKMFNLYVQPDPAEETNLIIEPLIDFYSGNDVLDWSDKVDYSKEILIKPCSIIEGKDYVFRYKPDNDYYNSDYRKKYESEYGERKLTIANDFAKGNKLIELIFSPTPLVGNLSNNMAIPRIISVDPATGAIGPYNSNVRILYYTGVLSYGAYTILHPGANIIETTYAQAGNLDHPYSPTLDLLFDKPRALYYGSPSNIGANYTDNNIYNKYWATFIEEITDRNSKIITANIRMRPIDILNISFKDFIFIDGVNYRLNKIIDYNPRSENTCKVELAKVKEGRAFVGQTIIVDNTSQDPILFDILEGGKDEIRNPSAISIIKLVDGGKNTVKGLQSIVNIDAINGGKS